jgi:hypothetical protein
MMKTQTAKNLLHNLSGCGFCFPVLVALALGSTMSAIPETAFAASSQSFGSPGLAIPLYTYPCFTTTQCTWTAVIQARQAYPSVPLLAVINPNSGPGSSKDSNYVQGIKNLQAAGVVVLGYVWTDYGRVSLSKVEQQVSSYKNWYAVNGIFFDGMANVAGGENYYSTLNTYVKSLGMTYTMGNPGTTTLKSYICTMDSIIIYESAGTPSLSYLASATFYPSYSKSNFGFVSYSVPSLDTSFEVSSTTYVQWLYITDAGLPNPYDKLPSYFTAEVGALGPHPTATAVSPNPASVTAGTPITFTATVTDRSAPSPSSPSGTVSWGDNGAGGSFLVGTCTLSSSSSSQSQCTITYVAPITPRSVTIAASYSGDSTHLASSGASSLTVT